MGGAWPEDERISQDGSDLEGPGKNMFFFPRRLGTAGMPILTTETFRQKDMLLQDTCSKNFLSEQHLYGIYIEVQSASRSLNQQSIVKQQINCSQGFWLK